MPWTVAYYDRPDPDVLDFTGDLVAEFAPENLSFTLNKAEYGPSEFNCEVSRSRSIIGPDFIGPYRNYFRIINAVDIASSDDTDVVMAGPITMLQVNSREEHAKIAGKSWEHHLEMLNWPFQRALLGTDSYPYRLGHPTTTAFNPPDGFAYSYFGTTSAIITDIFAMIMSQTHAPYMALDIISLQDINQLMQIDLIDTESFFSKIQSLSQNNDDGFWFRVTSVTRELSIKNTSGYASLYNPTVVTVSAANCEYHFDADVESSGIYDISYTNTGPAATWLLGTGNNVSNDLASLAQYTPAQAVYGLMQMNKNYSDIRTQAQLDALTKRDLLFNVNPVHELSVTVVPDQITNFWQRFYPGVPVWITADLEAHVLDSAHEIVSMDVGVTNQDNNLVTLKLNKIYLSAY